MYHPSETESIEQDLAVQQTSATASKAKFAFKKQPTTASIKMEEVEEETGERNGQGPSTGKTVSPVSGGPAGGNGKNVAQFPLSTGVKPKQLTVRTYGGKVYVDIREYYIYGGQRMPSKKGITLHESEFKTMQMTLKAINSALYKAKKC